MNGKNGIHGKKLYGTATVGTKGQIVIPANARVELSIESGDRLYVVGSPESGFLGLIKEESLEQIIEHLSEQVQNFRSLKQDNKE
ncbi:MAG: AbrB/MazE/SpoVT family DNA-binding domain-containing protein [Candidatus Saccharibacteria bacterium]|jgi:AbrB family looped-hinge helix DNA binding protein|nr:MAG: AbrB/MazE/SpoVT family DNA-binding domain-containing protein [Candidatus Saccharibacteria bacterium]